MRLDEASWAAIRHALTETDESKVAIARSYGIAVSTIARHAAKEGWKRRPNVGAPTPKSPALAAGRPRVAVAVGQGSERPEVRLARMMGLVDMQLEKLERRMGSPDGTTPQDEERDIRTLNATIGCLEKITEVGTELAKTRTAEGGAAAGAHETERLRREIVERLERLNAQWLAHEKSR